MEDTSHLPTPLTGHGGSTRGTNDVYKHPCSSSTLPLSSRSFSVELPLMRRVHSAISSNVCSPKLLPILSWSLEPDWTIASSITLGIIADYLDFVCQRTRTTKRIMLSDCSYLGYVPVCFWKADHYQEWFASPHCFMSVRTVFE